MFQNLKRALLEHPLDIRLLIIASIAGVIFSLLTTIINLFFNIGWKITLVSLLTGVISSIIFYFAAVRRSYVLPVYLGM